MKEFYYIPEVDADCERPQMNLNRHDCGLFVIVEDGRIRSALCLNTARRYFEQSISDEELLNRVKAKAEPISRKEFVSCLKIYR